MPLMMMLVMPWAANQEVKNVQLSLIDNDHSTVSERMVRKVVASGYFRLSDVSENDAQAMWSIEAGSADIILEIPADFEKTLVNGGVGSVSIRTNAVDGMKGGLGSSYLSMILSDYSAELRAEYSGTMTTVGENLPIFSVVPHYAFNPHLDYKVFMVPALMVMLLTMLAGFLPALNIVGEKEAGTIEQINVTPVKKFLFVLAKLIPYWVIGFVVMSLCMLLAALIYDIYPVGSLLTVYLFATIYILVVSGMALVISNYSDTMQQAMFVMFFFVMIFILMSGLFTPISSMPDWAQTITYLNPLRYFMQVMRLVYLKGSGFAELLPSFFALDAFAAFFGIWAVVSYRKSA